jgi:hypothetical protein
MAIARRVRNPANRRARSIPKQEYGSLDEFRAERIRNQVNSDLPQRPLDELIVGEEQEYAKSNGKPRRKQESDDAEKYHRRHEAHDVRDDALWSGLF